jgi:hypothetical protein
MIAMKRHFPFVILVLLLTFAVWVDSTPPAMYKTLVQNNGDMMLPTTTKELTIRCSIDEVDEVLDMLAKWANH